ncbi:MAG: hypothetical protein ACI9UJ_001274 [bacterium]|jgi:hypothetical protein
MEQAYLKNNWFTTTNVTFCLDNWRSCLTLETLEKWLSDVPESNSSPQTIGIIMAGNIPLVGFHDLLCVICTGHKAKIKLSDKDEVLMKYCLKVLNEANPTVSESYEIAERVIKPDALIATGSNNSARYFDYYFRDMPSIIRKNRTSIAVITGKETKEELTLLADDIFQYFGLGCRNVTKLFIPKEYDLIPLLDATAGYEDLANHNKYANNTTYHRAIFLMNLTKHLDTGYLLVKEDENLHAPLSCLFYQHYETKKQLDDWLLEHKDGIQTIVSHTNKPGHIPFGSTQTPGLSDYADGVNTLGFLLNL